MCEPAFIPQAFPNTRSGGGICRPPQTSGRFPSPCPISPLRCRAPKPVKRFPESRIRTPGGTCSSPARNAGVMPRATARCVATGGMPAAAAGPLSASPAELVTRLRLSLTVAAHPHRTIPRLALVIRRSRSPVRSAVSGIDEENGTTADDEHKRFFGITRDIPRPSILVLCTLLPIGRWI